MLDIIENDKLAIIEAFNNKPKEGIDILNDICLNNNLDKHKQLAELFLQEKSQLNLDHVGDYLSGPGDDNKNTLKYFISKMDFKDKSLVPALRDYLQKFKLPGEGQQIDRLVAAFGERYFQQNPNRDGIVDKDAAYILAYQVIMLNSDLHKPGVKEKMSLDALKKNLRGLNGGNNFSEGLLADIYKDIKTNPFEFNFVEISPKYVLSGKELYNNETFVRLDNCFNNGKFDITDIFPKLKNDNTSYDVTISRPKSFLNKFTDYQGEMSITGQDSGNKVGISFYKPSIVSAAFGRVPEVTLLPIPKEGKKISKDTIELAANMAASFPNMEIENVHATYDYLKESLIDAYSLAKTRNIAVSLKERTQNVNLKRKLDNDIMKPVHKIKKLQNSLYR